MLRGFSGPDCGMCKRLHYLIGSYPGNPATRLDLVGSVVPMAAAPAPIGTRVDSEEYFSNEFK